MLPKLCSFIYVAIVHFRGHLAKSTIKECFNIAHWAKRICAFMLYEKNTSTSPKTQKTANWMYYVWANVSVLYLKDIFVFERGLRCCWKQGVSLKPDVLLVADVENVSDKVITKVTAWLEMMLSSNKALPPTGLLKSPTNHNSHHTPSDLQKNTTETATQHESSPSGYCFGARR